MNQVNWTFVSNTGNKYDLKLLHGKRTGHVLILNNMKVLRIDFKVLDTKSYSFFIDDELIKININREGDAFTYSFDIDHETDTPLNKAKKIQNKRFWRYTISFFAVLLVVIFGFKFVMQRFNSKMSNEEFEILLNTQGIEDKTIIYVDSAEQVVKYTFISKGLIKENEMTFTAFDIQYKPIFPLIKEQAYQIRYVPTKPMVHRIDFANPETGTLSEIFKRTSIRHQKSNSTLSAVQARCEVEATFQHFGLQGLANIFNQSIGENVNKRSNERTFQKMKERELFKLQVVERCR